MWAPLRLRQAVICVRRSLRSRRSGTCRGSYYQRVWQALAQSALGLQHVAQPNVFALQLPHPAAYSRAEAAWGAFKQVRGPRARAWSVALRTACA